VAGWGALIGLAVLSAGYYVMHKPVSPDFALNLLRLFWQVAVALLILSASAGIGRRLLYKIPLPPLAGIAVQAGLGAGLISLGALAAGYLGLFRPLWAGVALALIFLIYWRDILAWWSAWRSLGALWLGSDGFGRAVGVCTGLIFAFTLVVALAPPLKYDALVYHLVLPQLYLEAGRLEYLPQLMYWGMPQNAEMLYAFGMSLGGGSAAVVLGWLVGLLALLGIFGLTADYLGLAAGWAAVAALACGYTLASGLSWGYNDWWVIFDSLGFLVFLIGWVEHRRSGLLALSGLFAGLAVGTKYTAGLLVVCGSLVIVWNSFHSGGARVTVKALFQFAFPALLIFLPWLAKNWLATGNPFYPLLFPAGAMSELRLSLYQGGQPWGNWLDFFLLPVRATIWGVEGAPGYSASIGPLLLGLGLAAGLNWRTMRDRQRAIILTSALVALSGISVWMVAGRFSSLLLQSRLYVAFFPALAVLAGAGYTGLSSIVSAGARLGRVASFLILLVLGLTTVEVGIQTIRQRSLPAVLGLLTPQEYLEHNLGWYASAMSALRDLPEGARALMLWEPRSLYCQPVCKPDEIIDRWLRERYPAPGAEPFSARAILQSWTESGYTHLLLHKTGADFLRREDLAYQPSDWQALDQLLALLGQPESFGGAYLLYQLVP